MPKSGDQGNIKVCVRVRPFIAQELNGERRQDGEPDLKCCVAVPSETALDIWKDDDQSSRKTFEFDRVYWSHSKDHELYATQETLQKELGETMLSNAIEGFNNCIFAYGQTGSGKSFSVLGGKGEARGMLPRVVEGLFGHIGSLDSNITCRTFVSFLEIYNEQIRDLLAPEVSSEVKLEVKQHPVLGVIIPGLTESAVENAKSVMELVDYGAELRRVAETSMNAASSRSHCVFTFSTSFKDETSGESKLSRTNLVDLAGSERAKRTKAEGARLREGANINQSLSVLARVISSLAENKKATNTPFRDSKLTYMLKESLSGNSKTIMVAALSPSNWDYEETMSTIKFAQSVKLVQTSARQNTQSDENIEKQLQTEADKLKKQLLELESSPDNDCQRQIERAQRKLEEQQELLNRYAPSNWEEQLARERQRRARRRATVHPGEALLTLKDQVADFYKRNPRISWKVRTDGGDASSNSSLFDNSSVEADDLEDGGIDEVINEVLLVRFATNHGEAGEDPATDFGEFLDDSRPDERECLIIQGRFVQGFMERPQGREYLEGEAERERALTEALENLEPQVSEAEQLARQLSQASAPVVRLRAAVAVDLEGLHAGLVVCVGRGSTFGDEWLSADEFSARLEWLRERASLRDTVGGATGAWAASATAVSRSPLGVQPGGSSRGVSDPSIEDLRRELAELEAELAKAKRDIEQELSATSLPRGLSAAPASTPAPGKTAGLDLGHSRQLVQAMEEGFTETDEALRAVQATIDGSAVRSRMARAS